MPGVERMFSAKDREKCKRLFEAANFGTRQLVVGHYLRAAENQDALIIIAGQRMLGVL